MGSVHCSTVCHSLRTKDMAGNLHVLSVGLDLAPALQSNGVAAQELVDKAGF